MILPSESYGDRDSDSHIMMFIILSGGAHVGSRASFWIGELPLAALTGSLRLPLQCQCPRATGRFLWFCGQCPQAALPAATSPSPRRLPPRRAEARSKSADEMTSDSESDSDFGRPLPLLASSRFQGAAVLVAWR
jgi:hypothetical protein